MYPNVCYVTCRAQQTPPQPTIAPAPLGGSDIASPADVEVSLVSPDVVQLPKGMPSDVLTDMQSPSSSQDRWLRDSTNQLLSEDASFIKAAMPKSALVAAAEAVGSSKEAKNVIPPQQIACDQSSSALMAARRPDAAVGEGSNGTSLGVSHCKYDSMLDAKLRADPEEPPEGLPQLMQGQSDTALSTFGLQGSTFMVTKQQSEKHTQPLLLPALKLPMTGMGGARVSNRVLTPQCVAEGSEPWIHGQLDLDDCSQHAVLVDGYMQDQPGESQEEEAAESLRQHLSSTLSWPHHISFAVPHQPACVLHECSNAATAQRVKHSSKQGGAFTLGPIAEGKESIAAFHPSWHLRLNQTARFQLPPEQTGAAGASGSETSDGTPLDLFYRPMAGNDKAPQHQSSMVEEAGCINFGSHLVPNNQIPEEAAAWKKRPVMQNSAIDDAVLVSEDEEIEYEAETRSQPFSPAESGADHEDDSGFRRDSVAFASSNEAEDLPGDALQGQGQVDEAQYADYRSEEGLSEEGYYSDGRADTEGVDQSLDVLPAGITTNTEVYSPMSHGATRVRSMITNRPFLLEEPVSPVAEQLAHTMRQGTLSNQATTDNSTIVHNPLSQEEPLYHDWSQPSAAATAEAAAAVEAEAAAAAEAEAAAAAQAEYEAQQAAVRKPLSDPNTVRAPKPGAMTRLADSLFRRSGKRTIETQTTEFKEEETQTSDAAESQAAAQQTGMTANGGCHLADVQYCLCAESVSYHSC